MKAASKAFETGSEWRSMSPNKRSALILKLADLIRRDAEQIAVRFYNSI